MQREFFRKGTAVSEDYFALPATLPVPQDDGACDHLTNITLPDLVLRATSGSAVNIAHLARTRAVIFTYPRTGNPQDPDPSLDGWDEIPGARGCTPQSCGFRDLTSEFAALGYAIAGLSTQSTEYQFEFVRRMHIPFDLMSDSEFALTDALLLPTFTFNGERLLKRMAWVLDKGKIEKVFYPVFPPGENSNTVLAWLRGRADRETRVARLRSSVPHLVAK